MRARGYTVQLESHALESHDWVRDLKVVDWPKFKPDRRIRAHMNAFLSRDQRERFIWIEAVTVVYLITFACYGCHLHGDPSGSVDRHMLAAV